MNGQAIALLISGFAHVGAAAILIAMLIHLGSNQQNLSDGWGSDDGPGGGPDDRPTRGPGGGGIPLANAQPSAVRLRGPGTIADAFSARRRAPHRRAAPQRASGPAS